MPSYSLRGLTINLPPAMLTDRLHQALSTCRYEKRESGAIMRHLGPIDRFLDLGSGLGYVCAVAARIVGEEAVTGIEAGAEAAEAARHNLSQNGFGKVRLIHGAVTARDEGEVEFVVGQSFWSSGLKGNRISAPLH